MELLSFKTTARVLHISPERLGELLRTGRIDHIQNQSSIEFTWGQIERFIQRETGFDVFTAQRMIADKIWPNEK